MIDSYVGLIGGISLIAMFLLFVRAISIKAKNAISDYQPYNNEPEFKYYKAVKKRFYGLCGMTVVYIETYYDESVQEYSFEDFIKMNHGDDFSVTEITKEEYDNRAKKSPN